MVLKSQFSHPHRPRSPASPPTSKTGFKQISCDLSLILLEINAYATFFRDVKLALSLCNNETWILVFGWRPVQLYNTNITVRLYKMNVAIQI